MNAAGSFALNARNNYVHAPGKFVATVGVNNLVIVETEDALLITTLEHSQDVGKIVKYLDEKKMKRVGVRERRRSTVVCRRPPALAGALPMID